jgi:hypothetical protein
MKGRMASCWPVLIAALALQGAPGRAAAGESEGAADGLLGGLSLSLEYASRISFWIPDQSNTSSTEDANALRYKTESVPSQLLAGVVRWRGIRVLGASYERPLSLQGSGTQHAALETVGKQAALVRLHAFLELGALELLSLAPSLRWLDLLRFDVKLHQFHGRATAISPILYHGAGGDLSLEPGESISVASRFAEVSLTAQAVPAIYLGVYQRTDVKPYERSTSSTQVVDARISGVGFKLLIDAPYLGFDLDLGRARFDSSVGRLCDDGFDLLARLELHPRFFLIGSADAEGRGRQTLVLMPMVGGSFAWQTGGNPRGQVSNGMGEGVIDMIVDAALVLRYRL